jgi:hypothetical protein
MPNNKNEDFSNLYDEVPEYVKNGLENAKKEKLIPAPPPPVHRHPLPLSKKIGNLSNSIRGIVSDFVRGKETLADEDLVQQRMNVCNNCPYVSDTKTYCTECGCILTFKTKFKNSSCPKKYW